ncbi:glycosyltransferase family 4 protein [Candidatus Woesearchaeota archaeon]|nr:glycosyltransferase family 4 protein [Candidatus Woesearchaeota archaeon]
MKIAFTCTYSYPSASGVWNYVYNIAKELIKQGHEVHVFSSNRIAGTNKTSSREEVYEGIYLHRFPVRFKVSENYMLWNPYKAILKIKPDVIHCNTYRHLESIYALRAAEKLKVPSFLTTHAPFVEAIVRGKTKSSLANLFDKIYGKKQLRQFTKVIAIANWELPYLKKLTTKEIEVIHPGIDAEFLKIKIKQRPIKKVLFMGRVAPVKNVTMIGEIAVKCPELNFKIYGPVDEWYNIQHTMTKNVEIINKRYTKAEEIKELNNAEVFILSSKREGIPLALSEAMAAGKIVLSSRTQGGTELIQDKKNGFLFTTANEAVQILKYCEKNWKSLNKVQQTARTGVQKDTWKAIAKKLEKQYKKTLPQPF